MRVADMTRLALADGDPSIVISLRSVISRAESAEIFGSVRIAFWSTLLNECDKLELSFVAEFYPGNNLRRPRDNGADPFCCSVTAAIPAITGDHELKVSYFKDRPALSGNRAWLSQVLEKACPNNHAVARGLCGPMALKWARHDGDVHARFAPEDLVT
jgi:hypothetical protein